MPVDNPHHNDTENTGDMQNIGKKYYNGIMQALPSQLPKYQLCLQQYNKANIFESSDILELLENASNKGLPKIILKTLKIKLEISNYFINFTWNKNWIEVSYQCFPFG